MSSKQEIKATRTADYDPRFPYTQQTKRCWTSYIEFHRCVADKGDQAHPECLKFKKNFTTLCPDDWVAAWDEQREAGKFPGPL